MSVWLCVAFAKCDDCDKEYSTNNAMGLMAKHCKKEGHSASVTMEYGIEYKKSSSPKKKGGD